MSLFHRLTLAFSLVLAGALAAPAQETATEAEPPTAGSMVPADEMPRQTLEDILRRQQGVADAGRQPRNFEAATESGRAPDSPLGALGGLSDSEMWDAVRFGTADNLSVSAGGDVARVLMQDGGTWWWQVREGPLRVWGGWFLLGVIAFLAVFFLLKGRIRISGGRSAREILRFNALERFGHWLLASSFILLGLTGLFTLFGRKGLIPLIGHETYATLATGAIWIHNNVSWAFMLALVLVFVLWVADNIPKLIDLKWLAKGGGFIGDTHPPAEKFNAGQKLIFWSVIVLGASISASGLSMLFPFQLPMFEATFAKIASLGLDSVFGWPVPTEMTPQEEMIYAQLWHAIVGFVLMGIILAHIYIGSIGMEGAFAAMGSGRVDYNWARDHHSLWVEKEERKDADNSAIDPGATPAE